MLSFRKTPITKMTKAAQKRQASNREAAINAAKELITMLRGIECFNTGDVEALDDAISEIRGAITCIRDINGLDE